MNYIGIDPGLTGVVAWFTDEDDKPRWFKLPVKFKPGIKFKKDGVTPSAGQAFIKKQIDCFALGQMIDAHFQVLNQDHWIMMERVSTRHGQGMASAGSLMHTVGAIEGVFNAMFEEVEWVDTVPPQVWMLALGLHGKHKKDKNVIKEWVVNTFDMPKRFNKDVADAIAIAWYNKQINQ